MPHFYPRFFHHHLIPSLHRSLSIPIWMTVPPATPLPYVAVGSLQFKPATQIKGYLLYCVPTLYTETLSVAETLLSQLVTFLTSYSPYEPEWQVVLTHITEIDLRQEAEKGFWQGAVGYETWIKEES